MGISEKESKLIPKRREREKWTLGQFVHFSP